MRLNIVWTIFRKELTEALRDRLTLLVVVGLPLLIYPGSALVLTRLQRSHDEAEARRVSQVAVWGPDSPALLAALAGEKMLKVEAGQGAPEGLLREIAAGRIQPPARTNSAATNAAVPARALKSLLSDEPENDVLKAARTVISDQKLDAVIVLWPGFNDGVNKEGLGRLSVYYDSVRPASAKAWKRVAAQLENFREELVAGRQSARGLPGDFSTALSVQPSNVAPAKRVVGDLLGRMLPMLLLLLSVVGALNPAMDLTAGEKDRATMQTLLCAPVSSLEIVTGKFLAIWCVGMVSSAVNVLSMALTMGRIVAALGVGAVSPGTLLLVLLLLLPATWTIAAVFMAVAALARDVKDAGNFLGAAMMLLIMPVAATAAPGVELDRWTSFVPLVNLTLLLRAVFLGGAAADLVLLTLVASGLYATLALMLAAKVFGQEQVLLGGKLTWSSFFRRDPDSDGRPTPAFVVSFFAVAMVVTFYASALVEKRSLSVVILATQYGCFLLPVALAAWLFKFPVADTFSLRRPSWRSVAASVLIGCSASVAVAGLVLRLLPPPDSVIRALQEALLLGDKPAPLWQMWLVLALTPAVCEETLFRGLILSGLRRWGPWPAIGVTALLFGVAHASIYRLLPTFALGLILGFVVWRTGSLLCSILVHALNNGLVVTVTREASLADALKLDQIQFVPWSLTLGALAVLAVGLLLLPRGQPTRLDAGTGGAALR
jgi:sodium transport system permease protein